MFEKVKRTIICLVWIIVHVQAIQVIAQPVNSAAAASVEVNDLDSCSLLVSQDSSYAFVKALPVKDDMKPPEVEVTIQVGDYEPCVIRKAVPVELYFPKRQFSVKVIGKEKKIPFRFISGDEDRGSLGGMMQTREACLEVDANGGYKLGCNDISRSY